MTTPKPPQRELTTIPSTLYYHCLICNIKVETPKTIHITLNHAKTSLNHSKYAYECSMIAITLNLSLFKKQFKDYCPTPFHVPMCPCALWF